MQLDREVAIKIPSFRREDGPEDIERFYREARAMATLSHPNLCPVHDVGEIDGVHYLTMQFVEGRPLDDFLKGGKSHSPKQVAAVIRKLALALAEAHQAGVIHRDLKPANIMLDKRNEPIIMDFGLAQRRKENETTLTQSGQIMGTPAYMSPEQVKGRQDAIGPASDVYALGVICYQLLTGRLPFTGSLGEVMAAILTDEPQPPSRLNPQVDRSIEAICVKAMAKDMGQRYASAADLAKCLRGYLSGERLSEEGTRLALPEAPATKSTGSVNTTGKEMALAEGFFADLVVGETQELATAPNGARPPAPLSPSRPVTARSKAGVAKRVPHWLWIAGGGGAGLVVLLGLIVVLLPGAHGTIRIEINDPAVEVSVSESGYTIKGAAQEDIELQPGEHLLTIKRGDFSFESDKFVLKKGETVVVKVEYIQDEIKVTRGETVVARKTIPAGPGANSPGPAVATGPPSAADTGAAALRWAFAHGLLGFGEGSGVFGTGLVDSFEAWQGDLPRIAYARISNEQPGQAAAVVDRLAPHTKLTIVEITGGASVDDALLTAINAQELEVLRFECPVSQHAMDGLSDETWGRLTAAGLQSGAEDDALVAAMLKKCPKLESLHLNGSRLGRESAATLASAPVTKITLVTPAAELQRHLGELTKIDVAMLVDVRPLDAGNLPPNLVALWLERIDLGASQFEQLAKLTSLKVIGQYSGGCDQEALRKFRQDRPEVEVRVP